MTMAEQLRAEGRAQGLAQGHKEAGQRTLRRLLTKRFGPLPEWVEQQLNSANAESLEIWTDAVPDAPSLQAIFDSAH